MQWSFVIGLLVLATPLAASMLFLCIVVFQRFSSSYVFHVVNMLFLAIGTFAALFLFSVDFLSVHDNTYITNHGSRTLVFNVPLLIIMLVVTGDLLGFVPLRKFPQVHQAFGIIASFVLGVRLFFIAIPMLGPYVAMTLMQKDNPESHEFFLFTMGGLTGFLFPFIILLALVGMAYQKLEKKTWWALLVAIGCLWLIILSLIGMRSASL